MSRPCFRLIRRMTLRLGLCAAALLAMDTQSHAQGASVKREHLGDFKDWSTFKDQPENAQPICYMISQPKAGESTPEGADRRNAFVMISHWPGRQEYGVVRLNSGFDYRRGAAVLLSVDGRTYELYGDGQDAWTFGLDDDAKIVKSMKRGLKAEVSSKAARGFDATDVFSLQGFTAAYNRISEACGLAGTAG